MNDPSLKTNAPQGATMPPEASLQAQHPKPQNTKSLTIQLLMSAAVISALSLILAVGLAALGLIDRANTAIATIVSRGGAETFPKHLPDAVIWCATAIISFSLAIAIIGSPRRSQRLILWISCLILTAAWAPVLSLAAHAPEIAAPWIATLWAGICSLVHSEH